MTITTWIEGIDPEGIYDHYELAADLWQETNELPRWPTHTAMETKIAIATKAMGGSVHPDIGDKLAWGDEVIAAMEEESDRRELNAVRAEEDRRSLDFDYSMNH